MGEIKSTLDLVLEKTKHLSLSAEEKKAQAQTDAENRLKGILQKYQDGLISIEKLRLDYDGLRAEFKLPDHSALAGEVINRLDPDGDNRTLLEALEHCCNLDSAGLADIIKHYQANAQTAAQSRMQALKENLAQNYHISGSAVVPNLETDEEWQKTAQELAVAFDQKINQERIRLIGN